jgi:hypothetical protein
LQAWLGSFYWLIYKCINAVGFAQCCFLVAARFCAAVGLPMRSVTATCAAFQNFIFGYFGYCALSSDVVAKQFLIKT